MSLNVEAFFTRAASLRELREVVRSRIASPPDAPGQQPDWGLPSSYDVLLSGEKKRKLALSPPSGEWVAGIESKEVLDFALLQRVSNELGTKVIAVQLYEGSGACGYAVCDQGRVGERRFSEDDEDPAATVEQILARNGVPFRLFTFREAIANRDQGWEIVTLRLGDRDATLRSPTGSSTNPTSRILERAERTGPQR